MTVFGWDASSYDDPPAVRDGIDFYTHKVTEGIGFTDPEFGGAIGAARSLGVPILGSYHVLWPGDVAGQAAYWVRQVDVLAPWWRAHPCWVWQVDAERFDYMPSAPTVGEVNALGDEIVRLTGIDRRRILAYAPTWVYGQQLTGLRYHLWASNYGANPAVPYRQAYPGDGSTRWDAPVRPLILQYGSATTIAGQSTCDANAFRGGLSDLFAALGAAQPGGSDMAYVGKISGSSACYVGDGLTYRGIQYPASLPVLGPVHEYPSLAAMEDVLGKPAVDLSQVPGRLDGLTSWSADVSARLGVLEQAVAALPSTSMPAPADVTAIVDGVGQLVAAATAKLSADTRDAVADLGEGGAAQVRAV